jgi:hypothetical protein
MIAQETRPGCLRLAGARPIARLCGAVETLPKPQAARG